MSNVKEFLKKSDMDAPKALHSWTRKTWDTDTKGLYAQFALFGGMALFCGMISPYLFVASVMIYSTLLRGVRKVYNYRLSEKGCRVVFWDDIPEFFTEIGPLIAFAYILLAIIGVVMFGPMVLAGAAGIGLIYAMSGGMQKIPRNEKVEERGWKYFDSVNICRKRNVVEVTSGFRIYMKDMTIDEFLDFARTHSGKDIEVIEGDLWYE